MLYPGPLAIDLETICDHSLFSCLDFRFSMQLSWLIYAGAQIQIVPKSQYDCTKQTILFRMLCFANFFSRDHTESWRNGRSIQYQERISRMACRHREFHRLENIGWLRAAALGANDGIVSTSSLILDVAAAHATHSSIVITGMAGLVAAAKGKIMHCLTVLQIRKGLRVRHANPDRQVQRGRYSGKCLGDRSSS